MSESSIVHDIESTYQDYLGAASEHRQKMQEWRQFTNGEVYTDQQKSAFEKLGLPPVSVPLVETCVDQMIATLTSRSPQWEVDGFDDSDVELSMSWNMFLAYIWRKSGGDAIHKRVVRDRGERGIGWKLAYFDPSADFGRGEMKIAYLDPNNVLVSPGSTDYLFRDSARIQVAKIVTAQDFLRFNGHLKADFLKGVKTQQGSELTPSTSLSGSGLNPNLATDLSDTYANGIDSFGGGKGRENRYLLIDNYEKARRTYQRVVDMTTGEEDIFSAAAFREFQKQPVWFKRTAQGDQPLPPGGDPQVAYGEMVARGEEGQLYEAPRAQLFTLGLMDSAPFLIDRIERTTIVGDRVVNQPKDLPISEYPAVPYPHKHIGSPYCKSPVSFAMQPARMYNRLLMLGMAYLSNAVGVRAFGPQIAGMTAAQVEQKLLLPTAYFPVEQGQSISFAQMPPLPTGLQSMLADMKHKIEYVFGIFEGSMGNADLAPETVRGGMLVDQQGQRRMKSHQQDIEDSDSFLGSIVMEYSQSVYTTDKYFRVLTPNGGSEQRRLAADNWGSNAGAMNRMLQTAYDVRVKSGSTLPVNREMEEQVHFRNFQAGLIDRVEYLKKTNLYDFDGVIKRTGEVQQMQAAMQEQATKIKNLEGDLQTATRESVNDRKRLEVNDFEVKLDKLLNQWAAEGKIAKAQIDMIMKEFVRNSPSTESLDSPEEQATEAVQRQDGLLGGASVE